MNGPSRLEDFRLTPALKKEYGVEDGWAFALSRRARWQEIDGFGHVNNVAYLGFYEDARNCYLECIGLPPLNVATPGPVLVKTSEEYFKPLVFEDRLLVTARTSRIGNTSLVMNYAIWNDGLVARGEAVCVLMINATGEKIAVPPAIRDAIESLENAPL